MSSSYLQRLFPASQAMPSSRPSADASKKRSLPFKAPSRVDSGASNSTSTKPAKAKPAAKKTAPAKAPTKAKAPAVRKNSGFKPASAKAPVVVSSDEESDDMDASPPPAKKQRRKAQAEVDEDDDDDEDDDQQEDEESDRDVDVDDEDDMEEPAQPVRKQQTKSSTNDADPPIPHKLLTRLLYEGFEDKNMKIGREAMNVVGKYIETFVQEALARAVFEREEADEQLGQGLGDGFLQVEDLEKLAPQLLLDF